MDDLNRAVQVGTMALDATPHDHHDRAALLSNLGNWLDSRFERTGSMDDLNRAVEVGNMALHATPHVDNLNTTDKLWRSHKRGGLGKAVVTNGSYSEAYE
jgi:hypothetical protein